ncbi:hypothetical protein Tco_0275932 [Tanacetum coccineum]
MQSRFVIGKRATLIWKRKPMELRFGDKVMLRLPLERGSSDCRGIDRDHRSSIKTVKRSCIPYSGSMEHRERSRVYEGTRGTIPEEIPTSVLKDRPSSSAALKP